MKFHKEGYVSLVLVLVFSAILIFIAHYFFPTFAIAHWFAYALSTFLTIVIVQFFRHPTRQHTKGDNLIIAPADGKVVVIEETTENEYFKDKRLQVSIFMSPINVHVNRYPIAGVVSFFKYHPGKFLAAWEPKSSTDNERTTIVVKHANGTEILFRQIAGALARRIVWYTKQGDIAEQCGEMGFIKFGSRVDLFLPVGTKLNVKIGDVVKGSQSVLGEI
ncbi:MAG: phosphatidylserine decarboxylase family protein [Bacteroidota bacterium]|nr:phosphatidylserine decarboxylase family protein [Bacteroidota bacterium]MDP3144173.1 phosphatidylserine decarboxylase family protein [Bacteroidota bacterium]